MEKMSEDLTPYEKRVVEAYSVSWEYVEMRILSSGRPRQWIWQSFPAMKLDLTPIRDNYRLVTDSRQFTPETFLRYRDCWIRVESSYSRADSFDREKIQLSNGHVYSWEEIARLAAIVKNGRMTEIPGYITEV